MQKNSDNFSVQEAMRLAKTPTGQQLISILKDQDPDMIQKTMNHAASGNYEDAKEVLSALLKNENVQKIMKQLGDRDG